MKHYFYFKKGQLVPQWLMCTRHADTGEIITAAIFATNGKVMVDVQSGNAVLWATSKRNQCIIRIDGNGKPIRVDGRDTAVMVILHLLNYGPVHGKWATGSHFKKRAPLVSARRNGINIRTTTKCLPLPEMFERVNDNI